MADRWFRLPGTGAGTQADPHLPQYVDASGIDGWAGQNPHPDGSPEWVVHVFGTTTALDDIAAEPDATELTDNDVETAMNNMAGVAGTRTAAEWSDAFSVTPSS